MASSVAGIVILPPDSAIPCWVAPQHCPTPFHQAKFSVGRNAGQGEHFFSTDRFQNRQKHSRVQRFKTDISASRVDAIERDFLALEKLKSLL